MTTAPPLAPPPTPSSTAAKPETPRQRALATLRFSRKILNDLLKDIPESKVTFQTSPHDNHVLWTLGHLTSTYNWFTGLVGGTPHKLPESFDKAFGHGAKPVADPNAYPSLAEVRKHFDAAFENYLKTVESLRDAELLSPCIGETYGFVRDRLDTIEKAAWHEGWHSGQISTLRRALGLKPILG